MAGKVGMTRGATVGPGVGSGSDTRVGAGVLVGPGVAVGRDVSVGPGAVQVQLVVKAKMASMVQRKRYFIANPSCFGSL
jgi:UDP-3-O-[3-hydroxymyristoyl] glucosamine N-acyltransferase